MAPDETQAAEVEDELLEEEDEAQEASEKPVEHPAFKVVSTRLAPHKRTLRRADPGKTRRKLFIAGQRVLPKRFFQLPLTPEQVEDEKSRLAEYAASGLIDLLEHVGDGDYEVVDLAPYLEEGAPVPAMMKPEPEDADEDEDGEGEDPGAGETSEGADDEGADDEGADEDEETYTREELEAMKKDELIALCEDNELDSKGNKDVLVDRLLGEEE
jgi:hypothetical protein